MDTKNLTRKQLLNHKYNEAVKLFRSCNPEYIPILENINVIWDYPDIEVAAISPNGLYLNGDWIINHDVSEVGFVLMHECLHEILAHRERCGERNQLIWNIANDLVINEGIKKGIYGEVTPEILKMPEVGIEFSSIFENNDDFVQFCKKFGLTYSGGMDVEQIVSESLYQYLLDKQEKLKKEVLEREIVIIQENKIPGLRPFEEEKQQKIDIAMASIVDNLSKQGNIEVIESEKARPIASGNSPNTKQKIENDLKIVELPNWMKEIQLEVKRKGIDRKTSSYSRLNRRTYMLQAVSKTRMILPGNFDARTYPNINVHIDTSGSVSSGMLKKIMLEMQSMCRFVRFSKLHFYFFTDKAYDSGIELKSFQKKLDLKQFEFPRGGTLLRPTMELYKNGEVKPADITIFITDGEFADLKEFPLIQKSCPRPGSTTFWIIDSDGKKRFKPLNRDDRVIYRRRK